MTNYTGNSKVNGGYYLSTSSFAVEVVPAEGGTLPGAGKFIKVPFPLLFAVLPVIGLAFLIFLPFIGFALVAYAVSRKVAAVFTGHAESLAATIAPDMATGAAYLAGHQSPEQQDEAKKDAPAVEASPEQKALEAEIAKRRAE